MYVLYKHPRVDLVGPLPTAQAGYRYLITMIDSVTKWPEVVPTDAITAETITRFVYKNSVWMRIKYDDRPRKTIRISTI